MFNKNYDIKRFDIAMEMVELINDTVEMKERLNKVNQLRMKCQSTEGNRENDQMTNFMMQIMGVKEVPKPDIEDRLIEEKISFCALIGENVEEVKKEILDELLAESLIIHKDISVNHEKLGELNWQL